MLTAWEWPEGQAEEIGADELAADELAAFRESHGCGNCGNAGSEWDGCFVCRHDRALYGCDVNRAEPGCWRPRWPR